MSTKETHIHPDSIEVVETYRGDDNQITSQVVHTANGGKFSSSSKQYCDPALLDGLIALRGDMLDDEYTGE